MILLDTNVVSELIRPDPDPAVVAWLADQAPEEVFLSAITEAELRYGVAILPAGHRRNRLAGEVDNMLREDFKRRVLPFDSDAARAYAEMGAARRAAGRPINHADCQIAAIAGCYRASVATRNIGDFESCGIDLINPWAARAGS